MRVAWLFAAGCSFPHGSLSATTGDAHGADIGSAGDAGTADAHMTGIDFLPPAEEFFGSTNWTVGANTTIDTTSYAITPPAPSGVTLLPGMQDSGAPIAILRVGDLVVQANRTLSAVGDKPLAIVSDHDITIDGTIDVGAKGAIPGAGGYLPAMGPGAGGIGNNDDVTGGGSTYDDAGGGGGSFGTAGSAGGAAGPVPGGTAGAVYPLTGLVGGSGGGLAGVCSNRPGAGGGALLVYADHRVRLGGAVTAGGGGGTGGVMSCATGSGSGAGGGSGGAIWIQTPELSGDGVLAANGGAGGGGSYVNVSNGQPGQDGLASTTQFAVGGAKANHAEATAGADGALAGRPATTIPALSAGNGGGGGGGLGRIVVRAPSLDMVRSSPAAVSP